jgi:hypothetical protein
MRHSEVDKRAKRNAPRQCVSDYGMHKDAGVVRMEAIAAGSFEPVSKQLERWDRGRHGSRSA